jgi:nucleoside-diphosphate-sugar epimerase
VGLANLLAALEEQGQRPRSFVFVSSTAVFAQSRGEWVDEDSPAEPEHFSGRRLLEAEGLLRESPLRGTVLRLGGIYGPRRTRLVEKVRQGRAVFGRGRSHYTNRIHRDDCVGALRHLIRMESPESLYLGVDADPAEDSTVMRWLAGTLGAPEPRAATRHEEAERQLRRGNKRCRNTRLVESGYEFLYPTFREGYTAVLSGQR